jgi:hypothetical protein
MARLPEFMTLSREIAKPTIKGALTFVPGVRWLLRQRGTGGSNSAEYCYEVWMKHMTLLFANGMQRMPVRMAELGPGDSLGVGLAAMLCGVQQYQALDVVRYANTQDSLRIFDELLGLFQRRAPRPAKGWPDYDHLLDERLFPSAVLTEEHLARSLAPARVARIRAALVGESAAGDPISISYKVPWDDATVIEPHSVDLIISHSVLEHVTDLDASYRAMHLWLKPGGMMSHQIDFQSHRLTKQWNGHRAIPEFMWTLMAGRRAFLINRAPFSEHAEKYQMLGLEPLCEMKHIRTDGIGIDRCARRWKTLAYEDLNCSEAFLQLTAPQSQSQTP